MKLATVFYALTFSTTVYGLTHTSSVANLPEPTQGPIWFARTPEFTQSDEHQSDYLLCKQAHGGQSRWVDGTTDCRSCFCLPDTQQVGCTRCSESEQRRMHKRAGPMGQRKADYSGNGTSRLYVNHEACVRANSGRVFTRECNRCVCHQNGSVSCVPVVPCNSRAHVRQVGDSRRDKPNVYPNYAECVRENGSTTFKRKCNDCTCLLNGAVACTKKYCPP